MSPAEIILFFIGAFTLGAIAVGLLADSCEKDSIRTGLLLHRGKVYKLTEINPKA